MPPRAFPVQVAPEPEPPPPVKTDYKVTTIDLGLMDGRKPVVVGIDQSLEGFAVAAYSAKDGTAFLWLCHPGDHGVRRLLNIQFFLRSVFQQLLLRCGGVEHVCMEGYSFGSQMAREKMGECGGTTKLGLVRELGVMNQVAYPTIVTPYGVKKFALGPKKKGEKQTKAMMLKAVDRKWGLDVSDDNLADAYTLARVAAALVAGDSDLAYEREVTGSLVRHTEWDIQPKPRTRSATTSTRTRSRSSG